MKKLICLLLVGWVVSINAQGITNTLGGNTSVDKFIVENSDSEAGLVVTGYGNVGIGTTTPWSTFEVNKHLASNINPIGIFQTTGTNSAAGIRFENANNNHFNIGIIPTGEFAIGSYNTNIALPGDFVRITHTGNVGIGFTSPNEKLEINGNMNLNGEINRKSATGTANLVPVAYGTINYNGNVHSGTGNFNCTWTGNHYEIVIASEDYYWTGYTTLVTTLFGGDKIGSTNSGSQGENKLNIWFYDVSSGTDVQGVFQFVTYKP